MSKSKSKSKNKSDLELSIGDDVTIKGTIVQFDAGTSERVLIRTTNKRYCWIYPEDISTIHPYKEVSKEDKRKGN